MTTKVQQLKRVFMYDGQKLADPDPAMTPEQVAEVYAVMFPELATATIEEPTVDGNKLVFKFDQAVGTKG
jgi:PRTRC genetic system protein C